MSERLSAKNWIDAGLRALAKGGIEAVRVEPLAKTLHVTKGGFYWHFKDRNALLEALLDAWKTRTTQDIIARIEEEGGDARTRLRHLFTIVFQTDGRLERAVRDWAAKDIVAQAVQRQVDQQRLDYLEALFTDLGFARAKAAARARLAYHALVGVYAMANENIQREWLAEHLDIILPLLVRKG